jgi:hypothetical protein
MRRLGGGREEVVAGGWRWRKETVCISHLLLFETDTITGIDSPAKSRARGSCSAHSHELPPPSNFSFLVVLLLADVISSCKSSASSILNGCA